VHGFQYSDFFAQRLDHVAQMLGREAEFGSAVRFLAARQLMSLAEQGRGTVSAIIAALQAQSAGATRFAQDVGNQGRQKDEGNATLQEIFSLVMASRERALPVIAASVTASQQVLDEIGMCHDSFAELVEISGVMDLAAINARLGASRQDVSRVAMSFLSDSVMDGAQFCRDALARSSDRLTQVAAVQDKAMLEQLVAQVARFTEAFDQCQQGLIASQQRSDDVTVMLQQMAQMTGVSDGLLQDCLHTASTLTQIVDRLDSFAADLTKGIAAPAVWPEMAAIYDSYTIAAEREVHDLLIGRPRKVEAATFAPELDDILF